ncbi:hypothetical protein [Halarchaeum nitratireducens]|uniref:Domain of unknown function domain-containing protein n=1 Tax=Halarchaeum nitratireducens TaxID=489913 RepID=A0A830GH08_9EURY|nr:hypothetical protein [Halarchaeum nitratireducens]GGN27021.1 hypothetical protein GCM10009021_31940 [Halarchaeum nitratireducens]
MSEDRPAALLTNAQRAYLRGEKDYRPSVERDVKKRIRNRLHAGVLDLSLAFQQLSLEEIDTALSESPDFDKGDTLEVPPAFFDVIGLIYLVDRRQELNGPHEGWFMETKVETGIERAFGKIGVSYSMIDVEIDIERGQDLENLAEEETLADLPINTLKQMLFADVIDEEEFAKATLEKSES